MLAPKRWQVLCFRTPALDMCGGLCMHAGATWPRHLLFRLDFLRWPAGGHVPHHSPLPGALYHSCGHGLADRFNRQQHDYCHAYALWYVWEAITIRAAEVFHRFNVSCKFPGKVLQTNF